ncbi:MAG: GIY-YIG nuclease family protein [Bacteroidota bacterium]|uniref:GIY-YIG nuclease family protein n=1 Tax=Runella sp. TaxID=1960881 RepID=UPI0030182CF6
MTRKELTEAYKNQKFRMGLFLVRNTANGKIFIESSVNLDKIWNRHRTELEIGSHRNTELQKDWKTYGEASFVFEVLAEIDTENMDNNQINKELKLLEQLYLEELQPFEPMGYNKKPKEQ